MGLKPPQTSPQKAHMPSIDGLKNTGLKATVPRLKILELFQKSGLRHMSAEDVYRLALDDRADIGLATIYRVLMQFEQAGILSRSQFEGANQFTNSIKGSTTTIWCVSIVVVSKSFTMPTSNNASTILPSPKGLRLPTTH